jgi:hypothetical protein
MTLPVQGRAKLCPAKAIAKIEHDIALYFWFFYLFVKNRED